MKLTRVLKRQEGKSLEFKRDISAPTGALRTLVAFANTAGGRLLIGIEDRSRNVRGVADPLALEERLASLVSDHIVPRLVPEIEILPWRSTHVVAVQVHASSIRPHHLVREGPERGTYVRVGSTNRRADADLIGEMRRFVRGEAFDEQPMPELDSEAIDFRAASESFADVRTLRRRDLTTLRILTRHQGRRVPTIGGILLFGVDRTDSFQDAWIQAGRFRGTDKSDIADQASIRSALPVAVEEAMLFVQKHGFHGARIRGLRRQDTWEVPPVALREALVNAVVHADYSQRGAPIRVSLFDDRLEVESPGLLPFGLTVDDLWGGVSRLRNRVIGRVFHELGLIEQWGSGIQRMAAACRDAGIAPPELKEIGMRFRVTLRTAQLGPRLVDGRDQTILDVLADTDGASTRTIAEKIGLTPRATRTRLTRLVERNLVHVVGTGPNDPRRVYILSER